MSKTTNPLVEVAVKAPDGNIPIGIMNAEQALGLPDHPGFRYLHDDQNAAGTGQYLSRAELKAALSKASARREDP